ncbi:MAG: hypothetical protein NVS1B14_03610 [Vulcanimicrobiaceae bacterium]
MSHELRQPLTAISAEAEFPASDRDASLRRIRQRANGMNRTLEDLLMLARADAGALADGKAELSDALAEACAEVKRQFPGIELRVAIVEAALPVGIAHTLLVRALANVVRNGMQAARKQVDVRAGCADGFASVTVDDDGDGVHPDERGSLFRRFGRGKAAGYAGRGLGLTIAAAIVEGARGSIKVSNAASGGARFTMLFPLTG